MKGLTVMQLSSAVGACFCVVRGLGRGKNEITRARGRGVGIIRLFMYWDTQQEPLRRRER